MAKIVYIYHCSECPNYVQDPMTDEKEFWGRSVCFADAIDDEPPRLIEDINEIPDFCPLQDD